MRWIRLDRNTKHRATVATYTRGGWEISVTRPTIHIVPARTRIKHRRICIPSLRGTSLWSACVQVGWNRWRGWKWRRPAPMRLHASGPGECKQEAPRWLLYFTRDVFWHWLRVNACDDRLRGTILQSPDSNTDFFYSSRWIRCHFWTSCSNETHANWMPVYSRWIFLSYDFFAHLFLCEFLDEVFEKIFKVVKMTDLVFH